MRCSCWQWPLVSFTLLSFAHHLTLPLLATDMTPNLRSGLSHAIVLCYQACDFWLFKGYPACSYIINHNTGCPNKFRMESVSRKSQSCASFFLSFFCQKNKPTLDLVIRFTLGWADLRTWLRGMMSRGMILWIIKAIRHVVVALLRCYQCEYFGITLPRWKFTSYL